MKLKQVLPLLTAILLLVSLGLSINVYGSAYQYYTLAQTNFAFDGSSSIYYEYLGGNNTVTVNQTVNASLNAMANYSSYYSAVATHFRDSLNFAGTTRIRVYQPTQSLTGLSYWNKVRLSNNLNLNYYLSQFSDYLGDNTVSAITLSFRAAAFYSGEDQYNIDLSSCEGKFNFLGYNIVATDMSYFAIRPSTVNPDLPSPNGYGLSGTFSINILVDNLADIFNTVIPFYFELSGFTSTGSPSQASLMIGFVMSDISLAIGFDRSVQELIDVNQNLIDLRGDISDLNDSMQDVKDAIDLMNNPNDPNYTSPSEIGDFGDAVDVMESAHRGGRSMIDDSIGTVQLSLPGLTSAYLQINRLYTLLINTPIGTILAFACSFGLCLFFIGSLKSKY